MVAERTTVPFLDSLRASGLLSDAQLAELAKCPEARDPAPTPLARVILQRGWLTRFQLNMIAAGAAKGLTVGPYLVLDRIGEGGMGMIYKARHQHMQRIVALKVIRKEKLASPDAVSRFYREVQMAGTLHHPNIVLAYDAGQSGQTHYFAMEYIDGVDLSRLVKEKGPLPVAQACDYIRQAALGLQHAHEKGLVHRDVKPSNLLVSGGRNGDVVKLLDMGLARVQGGGDTGLTKIGAVIGTPDYLAPEQAMNSKAADIRADLYSLGCSLYYLLTGKPPFTASELTEVLLKHQMEKPVPLAKHGVDAPKKVQAILDRLMAKHPDQRYQTPGELIEDLEPFCRATTLTAGAFSSSDDAPADDWAALSPDDKQDKAAASRSTDASRTEELSRAGAVVRPARRKRDEETARRKKRLLLMGIGGGTALGVLALVLYLVFGSKPEPVAQGARPTEPTGRGPGDDTRPNQATHRDGNTGKAAGGGDPPPDNPVGDVSVVAGKLAVPANEGSVRAVAFSPDGKRLAVGQFMLRLWDLGTNKELHNFGGKSYSSLRSVAWSADGRRVLLGGSQNMGGFPAGVLTLFNAKDGSVVREFLGPIGEVNAVAFSRDGKYVLSAGVEVIRWEVETGKEVSRYPGPKAPMQAVGFSDDEQSVYAAAGQGDPAAYVWSVGKPDGRRIPFETGVRSRPVFSPDRREVVITTGFNWVVYDLKSGEVARRSDHFPVAVWSLGWSRDGRFIAGGTMKSPDIPGIVPVYLTDAKTGKSIETIEANDNTVDCVAVSSDGGLVVSTSIDGARLSIPGKAAPPDEPPVPVEGGAPGKLLSSAPKGAFSKGHDAEVTCISFSTDGKKILSGDAKGGLCVWEAGTGKFLKSKAKTNPHFMTLSRFVGDGTHVVAVMDSRSIQTWEFDSNKTVMGISFNPRSAWAIARDGELLLYPEDVGVRIASSTEGTGRDFTFTDNAWRDITAADFSPDGESIVCASKGDGMIHVGDLKTKKEMGKPFRGPDATVNCLAVAPKLTHVLTADDKNVILWGRATGKPIWKFVGHKNKVLCLAFSPDGKYAVSGDADGMVCYWEVETGKELKRGTEHKSAVRGVAFSPDGRTIASCGDGIKLWDLQK